MTVDVVIEVKRGFVVGVYTNAQDAHVVVVDWDSAERPDGTGEDMQFPHAGLEALPDETRAQYRRAIA